MLKRLRDETASHPRAGMQISPEQGQFMQLLVKLWAHAATWKWGCSRATAAWRWRWPCWPMVRVLACDVSEEFTAVARRYWKEAGVAAKIEPEARAGGGDSGCVAHGVGEAGSCDFGFIDADKANDQQYYDRILKLLRPGGVVAVDNVLWSGRGHRS